MYFANTYWEFKFPAMALGARRSGRATADYFRLRLNSVLAGSSGSWNSKLDFRNKNIKSESYVKLLKIHEKNGKPTRKVNRQNQPEKWTGNSGEQQSEETQ